MIGRVQQCPVVLVQAKKRRKILLVAKGSLVFFKFKDNSLIPGKWRKNYGSSQAVIEACLGP
jgi:hypothetical protein